MDLILITAVSRPENLELVGASIARAHAEVPAVSLVWWLAFGVKVEMMEAARERWARLDVGAAQLRFSYTHVAGTVGGPERNLALDMIPEDAGTMVAFLDDDTTLDPSYLARLDTLTAEHPGQAIVVDQVDRDGNLRCAATPQCMHPCSVDTGMGIFPRELIGEMRFDGDCYESDGRLFQAIYERNPGRCTFVSEPLSIYNALQ